MIVSFFHNDTRHQINTGNKPVHLVRAVNRFVTLNPGVQFKMLAEVNGKAYDSIAQYRRAYYESRSLVCVPVLGKG